MDFLGGTKISLHDAVLERIEVLWERCICNCIIRPVSPERQTVILRFSGVTEVRIPHVNPWGPSSSILEVRESEQSYVLEMQSGDSISIMAAGYEIVQL
jgi:hypothetical protein